jgi:hypothetical protein
MVDGIKWWETTLNNNQRSVVPICPQHNLRMLNDFTRKLGSDRQFTKNGDLSTRLTCPEDDKTFDMPRTYGLQKLYVMNKIDAQVFSKMTVINLDDIAIPVANSYDKKDDSPYWIKTRVTKSKSGTRLILWAGIRDNKTKTQLFIEPDIKRLSFDQNDDHPTKVFTKISVMFADGVKSEIVKKDSNPR